MSSNVNNNPFLGSAYLTRYQRQTPVEKPFANPNVQNASGPNPTQNITRNGYSSEYEAFLANYRKQLKEDEAKRKEKPQGQQNSGESLLEKMEKLSQRQMEVDRLQRQLESAADPGQRRQLENTHNQKSLNYFELRNDVSLQFRGPGGGFVGSEGKIDHVGSFVTSA